MEHEDDYYTNCIWCSWYNNQRVGSKTGGLGKKEDEWKPSKLQHCWDGSEYWEEFWWLEETCCHLNSSVRLSASADVKNSQGVYNNNNNNYYYYDTVKI